MKWSLKREILPLCIIVVFAAIAAYSYSSLPDLVPSHFGFSGQPDSFSPKGTFVPLMAASIIGLYLLLTFVPLIDPFWKRIQPRYGVLLILRDFVLVLLLFLFVLTIIAGRTGHLPTSALAVGFGFFFIFLGNYLPKLPRNFFFGIRVPWTLASETVWRKTHIVSGPLTVIAGILEIVLSLTGLNSGIVLAVTLVPLFGYTALIYPFHLYRKMQKEGEGDSGV
jgi:uncharacterized membrane protein